jgi:hypothetical protein
VRQTGWHQALKSINEKIDGINGLSSAYCEGKLCLLTGRNTEPSVVPWCGDTLYQKESTLSSTSLLYKQFLIASAHPNSVGLS